MGKWRTLTRIPCPSGATARRDLEAQSRVLDVTFRVLEEVGYGKLTIGGVAVEAGVGKATIYRSWPNKPALVLAALRLQLPEVPTADLGDTRAELRSGLATMAELFASPLVRTVLPALLSEAAQDRGLAESLRTDIVEERMALSVEGMERAIERGDLPADVDVRVLLESWVGAMLFRAFFHGESFTGAELDALVEAALTAPPRLPATETAMATTTTTATTATALD